MQGSKGGPESGSTSSSSTMTAKPQRNSFRRSALSRSPKPSSLPPPPTLRSSHGRANSEPSSSPRTATITRRRSSDSFRSLSEAIVMTSLGSLYSPTQPQPRTGFCQDCRRSCDSTANAFRGTMFGARTISSGCILMAQSKRGSWAAVSIARNSNLKGCGSWKRTDGQELSTCPISPLFWSPIPSSTAAAPECRALH